MSKKKRNISHLPNNNRSEKVTSLFSTEKDAVAIERKSNFRLGSYLKAHFWMMALIAFFTLGVLGATLKYFEEDAKSQLTTQLTQDTNLKNQSLLNRINPFIANPTPIPTPQLATEYLYAGGKLLAVENAGANVAPPADLAVWRPDQNGSGTWYVQGSQGSQQTFVQWGASTDQPAPGDFDGDGKTDFSVFRPSTGFWYVQRSSDTTLLSYQFGQTGDKIAHADYDGDGRTDVAVFRNGSWYILKSSDSSFIAVTFGFANDTPAGADYDGDGKADIAVWRGSDKTFYVLKSSDGLLATAQVGATGSDQPVSADYDGDGRADYAVKSGNSWLIRNSSTNQLQPAIVWQQAGDVAVQNDYDGDGKVDVAVWHDANGTWYIRNSSDSSTRTVQWGMTGDTPVPALYRR